LSPRLATRVPLAPTQNDLADLMASNIVQCLGTMLSTVVF